jgi:hypothetical protein
MACALREVENAKLMLKCNSAAHFAWTCLFYRVFGAYYNG